MIKKDNNFSLHHVFVGLLRLDLLSLVGFEVLLRHLFAVVPGLTLVLVLAQNAKLRRGVLLLLAFAVADDGALYLIASILVAKRD